MEMIYFVMAEAYPDQLLKLVEALYETNTIFVIHVDKGQSLKTFLSVFKANKRKNIYFLNDRYSTGWGGFQLVRATLNGLMYIYKKFNETSRVIMLNGEDYPIKSKEYINSFFAAKHDKVIIRDFPLQYNKSYNSGVNRFAFYNPPIKLHSSSLRMSFKVGTIKAIFDFLKKHPNYLASFKDIAFADESFFQNILKNCDASNILRQDLLLTKWDKSISQSQILNGQDIDLVKKDSSLFARKFDPELSLDLLMFIDNNILMLKRDIHPKSNAKEIKNMEVTNKNAILFLTDKSNQSIVKNYDKLRNASTTYREVHLVYHKTKKKLPKLLRKLSPFVFDNSILDTLGYKPISARLVPGSNHFPLLKFYIENPQYSYYWNVEDDVLYNGEWRTFFDFFSQTTINSDFLSCIINDYNDQPSWYWWNTIGHPYKKLSLHLKVRSFNPIWRISNRALKFLHEALLEGWCGHHEVLIPTLLKNAGFLINDFGGTGKYILPACENKFYIPPLNDEDLDSGTMRYRPIISQEEINERLLYHPVKFNK